MTHPVNKPDHFDVLDGMRGVAALSVVLFHYANAYGIHGIFGNGSLAVDLFFMLSGFVLTHAYGAKFIGGMPRSEYIMRRIIRLYPMFLIGQALAGLAYAATGLRTGIWMGVPAFAWKFGINIFLLPAQLPEALIRQGMTARMIDDPFYFNHPSWSLFTEMVLSLLFVFFCNWSFAKKVILWLSCMIGFVIAAKYAASIKGNSGFDLLIEPKSLTFLGASVARTAYGFTTGALLFGIYQIGAGNDKFRPFASALLKPGSPAVYIAVTASLGLPIFAHGYTELFLLFLAPAMVLWGAWLGAEPLRGAALRRLSHWLGWISYPIYLVHQPVRFLVGAIAGDDPTSSTSKRIAISAVALALSIATAALTARAIEEPVRRWLTIRVFQKAYAPAAQLKQGK